MTTTLEDLEIERQKRLAAFRASHIDSPRDHLNKVTAQLHGLTSVLCGSEDFLLCNDEVKGRVLWLLHDLATDVKKTLAVI